MTILVLIRLTLGHRGRNLGHLIGVVLGITLAVVVLLTAVATDAALTAQVRLKLARDGVVEDLGHERQPAAIPVDEPALLRSTLLVEGGGGLVTVTRIAVVGKNPPTLPGLPEPPDVGEVLVSPALAAALTDPSTAPLRGWLPGNPTGILPDGSLVHPREFAAIAMVSADEISRGGRYEVVTRGGKSAAGSDGTSPGTRRLLLSLAAFAILVPVGSLIAVAVRLSATRRDQRNATLRLIGATPNQVLIILVAEAGVAAMTACTVGLTIAVSFSRVFNAVSLGGVNLYVRDLAPGRVTVVGALAFVTATAVVVAAATTRRLTLSPLGTQRRSHSVSLRWTRTAWLLLGAAALAAEGLLARRGAPERTLYILLIGGLIVTVLGLLRTTPLLIQCVARTAAWSPASMVASRRLQFDPNLGYRVVVGLALGAFAFGYLQVAGPATASPPPMEARADITVEMRAAEAPGLPSDLRGVDGVEDVVAIRDEVARLPDGTSIQLTVGECAGLLRRLRLELVGGGCEQGGVVVPTAVADRLGLRVGDTIALELAGLLPSALDGPDGPPPRETRRVSGVYRSEFEFIFGVLYDNGMGEAARPFQRLLVQTNGDPGAQQEVFAVTSVAAPDASAQTAAMRLASTTVSSQRSQQGLNAVLLGAVVIGIVAFSYGVLGMLADRSDLLALLRAIGMQRKGLLGVLGVELAIPLLVAVGVSLCAGLAVAGVQLTSLGRQFILPVLSVTQFLLIVGIASLGALAVLGIILVTLTKTRPETSL